MFSRSKMDGGGGPAAGRRGIAGRCNGHSPTTVQDGTGGGTEGPRGGEEGKAKFRSRGSAVQ